MKLMSILRARLPAAISLAVLFLPAALLLSGESPPVRAQSGVTLVISEIMYNPASNYQKWEWVEIYNPGATDVDLTGFVFDDDDYSAETQANIAGGTVPAGGTAVLFNGDDLSAALFQAAWGSDVNAVPVTRFPVLADGGDRIGLWASFADYGSRNFLNAVDYVKYDSGGDWPVKNGQSSIFLTDLTANNYSGKNWALSGVGTNTPTGVGYQSYAAGGNSGQDIGSPAPSDTTAITLAAFTATPGESGVTVTWETGTEIDNAGFNLYRAFAAPGPYTRLNPNLIPATGSAVTGAAYSYLDVTAAPDTVYFYKLEDIDTAGVSTFHGPVSTASSVSSGGDTWRIYLPLIFK